jgi:hypothetical protein
VADVFRTHGLEYGSDADTYEYPGMHLYLHLYIYIYIFTFIYIYFCLRWDAFWMYVLMYIYECMDSWIYVCIYNYLYIHFFKSKGTWDRDAWRTCICAGEYGYGLSVSGLSGVGLSTYLSGYGLSESFASGLVGPRWVMCIYMYICIIRSIRICMLTSICI